MLLFVLTVQATKPQVHVNMQLSACDNQDGSQGFSRVCPIKLEECLLLKTGASGVSINQNILAMDRARVVTVKDDVSHSSL